MKTILYIIKSFIILGLLLPLDAPAQNNYLVTINQPDPISVPNISAINVNSAYKINVVWEKNLGENVSYYKIYRESTFQTNKWDSIGVIAYSVLPVFTDSIMDPIKRSYNYRISSVDNCGNESPLSKFHNTINLSLLKSLNNTYSLVWNEYEGFDVSEYKIYRGLTRDNLKLIAVKNANEFSYSDTYAPIDEVFYQIEVQLPHESSVVNPETGLKYSFARSNIASSISTEINLSKTIAELTISPNPFIHKTKISFTNKRHLDYVVSIYNIFGEKLFSQITSNESVDFYKGNLSVGLYFIEVKGEYILKSKMLITE